MQHIETTEKMTTNKLIDSSQSSCVYVNAKKVQVGTTYVFLINFTGEYVLLSGRKCKPIEKEIIEILHFKNDRASFDLSK